MAQIFIQGAARMSYDGVALFAQDAVTLGTVFAPADTRIEFMQTTNNGYPDLVDGVGILVNKVPGVNIGQLRVSGVVHPDRGFHTFVNQRFGPRTGGLLLPDMMNLVPYSGGTAIGATGVYWESIRLSSSFSVQGGQQVVSFVATALVLDPKNFYAAATLTTPTYVGTAGAGIAPFVRASFNNDGATTYDLIRSVDFAMSNGMQIQPAIKSTSQRIAAGCTPGVIKGALTLTQLGGAANPVPQTDGTYPIDMVLPTGDGTHTLTVATSMSYDSGSTVASPTDFLGKGVNYSLFGLSAGSTTTAAFPIVASYV